MELLHRALQTHRERVGSAKDGEGVLKTGRRKRGGGPSRKYNSLLRPDLVSAGLNGGLEVRVGRRGGL